MRGRFLTAKEQGPSQVHKPEQIRSKMKQRRAKTSLQVTNQFELLGRRACQVYVLVARRTPSPTGGARPGAGMRIATPVLDRLPGPALL
jgi:hypothetical protein